jgi:hypothetical protein
MKTALVKERNDLACDASADSDGRLRWIESRLDKLHLSAVADKMPVYVTR